MPRLVDWRKVGRRGAAIVVALAACTLAAFALENGLGLPDASAVYLLGVAGVAIRWGATTAITTAVGAFLVYNFGFVEPRYTFTVANPEQFLNLVLFLVIGRSSAGLRARSGTASSSPPAASGRRWPCRQSAGRWQPRSGWRAPR